MNTLNTEIGAAERVIPLRGVRGMIADNMRKSLDEAAQLTHHADCDATALFETKDRLAEQGVKVSIEDLIAQAVVAALGRHPELNGRVEQGEIRLSSRVHLSMAMALPGNLLVAPAIFDACELPLMERSAARRDLLQRARSGKLSVTEMTGGTFTISNLGLSRVRHFTPIVNLPQIAILGIGETRRKPWVMKDGRIAVRRIMGLSLSFDHRAVDGAPAAAFLSDLCEQIEQG
ncbi:dihydrolipoamide acetyltransferase family protein [Marinobacterium arenosum]|uniref:dihydrolipoamide acetyltransferase family protein n=1 Tax=Marinobacterium arenosum TaxID=2862496 RepID=UPI001C965A3A|nr:dihydrolipoamide acetyltransferase family protein [Marinobacterium arenosum]MBY4675023.1 2-oxo acid dehydrogenase subunit E2 [Marinobacterium arenosum]